VKDILLCSGNPLLVKSIHGLLLDEGCNVSIAEHPSLAVQMVFNKRFTVLIIDSEPFGLSGSDAVKIIKTVLPGILVIFVGYDSIDADVLRIKVPVDLEELKSLIHSL
jgi:DNA-binding NtrC family response regulator